MDGKIFFLITLRLNLGKFAIETITIFRGVFGEHSSSPAEAFKWNPCFKGGRGSVVDDERPGRPRPSKTTEKFGRYVTEVQTNQSVSLINTVY
jgi:hypothetical protein